MFKTAFAVALFALTALGWQRQGAKSGALDFALALKEEKMILEHNVTVGEAVVRFEAESEEQLDRVQVRRPNGERLFVLEAANGTVRGLSGFAIELQEASLESIRAAFAEGEYDILATTAAGRVAEGSASLSLELPPPPHVLYPREGAVDVPTSGLTVHWVRDRWNSGYRVQLEQGETDGLAVTLPPGRNSLQIPDGFLARGAETHLEIAAIGANGNLTVVEVDFTTR